MTVWRSSALRRAGWTVWDQALTSLGNLLLAVAVARSVPIGDFGAFAIAFVVYLFALGISRAVATDPLVVRHSTGSTAEGRTAAASAVGASFSLAALMGAALAVVALPLSDTVTAALLALAGVLPALLVQDAWRFVFFAAGSPRMAAVNDACRIVVMLLLVGGLTASDVDEAWLYVCAWGASGAGGALLGCLQARIVPRIMALPSWWSKHKDLSRDFIGEHLAVSGVGALSTVIVALVAGVSAAAALRGAHVAFGAVNIFLQSGTALAVPEGRRQRERSLARLSQGLRTGSVALAVLPGLWLLALLVLPTSAGESLLGETWGPASEVFPAYALFMAATGATLGASVGLRVLERSRAALVVRLQVLPLSLVGAIAGAAVAGAVGVAVAMAAATGVGAVLWWRAFRRAVRQDHEAAQGRAGDAIGT